jgi:alkyl hydroperoxide reductase subunit F
MLDDSLKSQLKAHFERLTQAVEITASLDASPAAAEMLDLLRNLAELSPRITLAQRQGAAQGERTPSFALSRPGQDIGVRFAGVPMGHEFTSLILAVLQVGGVEPKASTEVQQQIRDLDGAFVFETYISLSCQNCPDVVQALNLMAAINPKVRHTMVDGAVFQQEVTDKEIMAVPTVYLNGEPFGQGRMTLEEILAKIDTGAAKRAAAKLSEKDVFDVLVVGGGPAGSTAAIYAARKGIRTGIVAERFGGQVQETMAIENFISIQRTEGPKLALALEEHVRSYGADIMTMQRATKLVPGELIEVQFESGASLRARTVVLATGARWRDMNVPGEKEYRTKGVAYCPHCDGPLFKGKRVAVIGGGNSGVEAAIDLAGIVSHVTLLEFLPTLRADGVLQNKLYSLPNVAVIKNAQTTEVRGDGHKVNGLRYTDRATGAGHDLALEGVFVQIGLLPATDWLKGTVSLTKFGEIEIDPKGATSVPGVFAAGDCTTVPYKQIVIALGEGAKASLSAFDHLIRTSAPAEKLPLAA